MGDEKSGGSEALVSPAADGGLPRSERSGETVVCTASADALKNGRGT